MRAIEAATNCARYVAADSPLDLAAAYKLEQRGVSLFSAIDEQYVTERRPHGTVTIARCRTCPLF
jgi:predicted house-cleaning NTP pyrophosphatase (Maf/HAM1 superfamily)